MASAYLLLILQLGTRADLLQLGFELGRHVHCTSFYAEALLLPLDIFFCLSRKSSVLSIKMLRLARAVWLGVQERVAQDLLFFDTRDMVSRCPKHAKLYRRFILLQWN
jgi:hypothetical protein